MFLQNALESVIATTIKRLCLKKSTNDMWKNDIFQKVIQCPINIAGMLNILHEIFKYPMVICNVSSYHFFTK